MKANLPSLVVGLVVLGLAGQAEGRDGSARPETKDEEKVLQIQEVLFGTPVVIKDFPEEMTLAKFLAALESVLPEGKKVSLRIDEGAFGKQLPRVAGATIRVHPMTNVTPVTILRRALSQVGEEVDLGIRPTGVVVTRPRLAAHRMAYDIRDVVREVPGLLPDLKKAAPDLSGDLGLEDGPDALARLVTGVVDLRPWETVEIRNGARLVVVAAPPRHEEVAGLIGALRRLSDVAVVMNARLYEVDRALYTKRVAPLFAPDNESDERPTVVSIDGDLFKAITRGKPLLESEADKLRPNRESPFLSRQSVFRYAAGPHPKEAGRTLTGSGTAGVSFAVRPVVSPDRRYLRLRISQQVVQLVRIDKVKTLDVSSGKEVEVEAPNLRKTSVTGTVQVPDGGAILMPVAYRPPGQESQDKVWLLVARPFIWIEEEVAEIRKGGGDVTPQSIWDSEVPKEEQPAPATPLPFNDEVNEILQLVVKDVLTNPDLKGTREFYGTAKDKTVALVDNERLGWPKEFKPDTHGYRLVKVREDPFVNGRRVLGVRVDKFDLNDKETAPFRTPIEVCLFNAGGSANGGVIGGCTVYYVPKRVDKRWTVEYAGCFDP
jgi:hypothetical protein